MKACALQAPCPCGRLDAKGKKGLAYGACCGRWLEPDAHGVHALAPDAEGLMRSRYSAFVLERADYLRASWAESHRPPQIAFEPGVKWLGLEVRAQRVTGENRAEVEFVARLKPAQGAATRLHERSRFVCAQGR